MQTSGVNFTWLMLLGSVGAVVLLGGAVLAAMELKKRRKRERRERPPQREKLLRPPGYSAMCQMDDIADKLEWWVIQAAGGAVLFGMIGGLLSPLVWGVVLGRFTVAQIWQAPHSSVLIVAALCGVIGLLWCIRGFQRMWPLHEERRNWRFGLRGEQAVAEKLQNRELAAAGYVTFHDVPKDGKWNIDHVVIGPGGVFVLETKARSRRKSLRPEQGEEEVIFDGRKLQFPWCDDWKAVPEVEGNARWMREFLQGFGPKDILIHSVIVLPGWFVAPTMEKHMVKVMNAKYLIGYLKGAKRVFTPEQLEPIIRRLDERCRVLEF